MRLHIVLVEPEIPSNTGNISRTCSVIGASLHLVHPLGFDISEKQVKGRLVLEAVAAAEGFEVTEDEVQAEIKRISEAYHMEYDKLKDVLREDDKKNLINDLKVQKALDFVTDNAVEVEKAE